MAKFADSLLKKKHFIRTKSNGVSGQFRLIYEMIDRNIPKNKALEAANMISKKGLFYEAGKLYKAAGSIKDVKLMGEQALKSDIEWERKYGSQECFRMAGDEGSTAFSKFLDENEVN